MSLILRHICFQLNYEKAIHLSSENNEDQTAQLALAPKVKDNEASNRDNDPDFINELHGNNALIQDVQIKTPQLLCSQGASAYSEAIKPLERCLRSYGCSYL